MKDFERIWFMGDIHGSYLSIYNFFHRNKENIDFSKETDCLILLGDVGANYYLNKKDEKFKKELERYPFTYFCIRGNHEGRASVIANLNPDTWRTELFFGNTVYVENQFPNIKYALDTVAMYNINDNKTLIIPGAYSVDKYYRLKNKWHWFETEQLTTEEMDLGRELIKTVPTVDLVLSHTCPSIYVPTDLFLSFIDQSMVDNTMERYLGEIEYTLDYKWWLWGHYHAFRRYPIGEDGRQRIMLSAGQEVINLEDIKHEIYKQY